MALIISVSPMRVHLESLETSQPYCKLLVHFPALYLHYRLSEHLTSLDTWPFRPYFMVDIACHLQNFEEGPKWRGAFFCRIFPSAFPPKVLEQFIYLNFLRNTRVKMRPEYESS